MFHFWPRLEPLRFAVRPAVWLACAALLAAPSGGAEFHLRSECRTEGGLVLVSDVADVYAADPDEVKTLSRIDLVAAPPDGQKRFLPLRELQDLLALRGLNLRDHRFTGASQVKIIGRIEAKAPIDRSLPLVLPTKQITETVRQAIALYLEERETGAGQWIVKLSLNEQQVAQIGLAKGLTIEGGVSPWTGAQSFKVCVPAKGGVNRVAVTAEIQLPPMVVVATQSLGRGAIVRPSDVRLQPGQASEGRTKVYQSLDEVIGKEVVRQVGEGQLLDDQLVRPQILVRRGEIVTVYARTAGIQVRVTARSRDDGSQGDLITVESLAKRETYFARVSGPQTCDVYAHAMTAVEDVAARPANAQRLAALKAAGSSDEIVTSRPATNRK
jgi:flagella basal body P-ring formation protein FlgA